MAATADAPLLRLNPRPRIERIALPGAPPCLVVDDALLDPEVWVQYAADQRDRFEDRPINGFPGPELRLPEPSLASLDAFFSAHARRELGGRRTLRRYARLSMVSRRVDQLQPWQWFCHTDRLEDGPGQCVAASVLYLFQDPALGGTSFYRPLRSPEQTAALVQASAQLPAPEFSARFGIAPGYMTGGNDWFEPLATVPARFNRLILYSGNVFHSGDIRHPERLSPEVRQGRLTLNGFYVCRRSLA
jgi:hypothetical protein